MCAALDDAGLAAKLAELGVANAAHVDALMDAIKRLKPASLAEFEGMPETQYFKVIHSAIRWQKPNVADLLTHPGTVECLDAQTGNTPIHIAAQNGYTDIVRVLIERGCNVNAKNNKGNTPMHMAMAYDYFEAVDALLAAGADPSIANEGGFAAETGLEGNKSFAMKVWRLHSTHHLRVDVSHLLFAPTPPTHQALMLATDEPSLMAAFEMCAEKKVRHTSFSSSSPHRISQPPFFIPPCRTGHAREERVRGAVPEAQEGVGRGLAGQVRNASHAPPPLQLRQPLTVPLSP